MKKHVQAVLLVVLAVVLLIATTSLKAQPQAPAQPAGLELASGFVDCTVETVHPPNGNDIPTAFTSLQFDGTTGIVSANDGIGTGGQLAVAERASCETLMADTRSILSLAGCSMSATMVYDEDNISRVRTQFDADFVCTGPRDAVIRTLGDLTARYLDAGGTPGTLALLSGKAQVEPRRLLSRRASIRPDGH